MKITVTVDASQLYGEDGELSFSEAIKQQVIYEVRNKVIEDFKKTLFIQFSDQVKKGVEEQKEELFQTIFKEMASEAMVKNYYGGEKCSFVDYIKAELTRTYLSEQSVNSYLNNQLKTTSENISKQLKERYDMLFASQIVSKLHENGMLKEEVAKMLLG